VGQIVSRRRRLTSHPHECREVRFRQAGHVRDGLAPVKGKLPFPVVRTGCRGARGIILWGTSVLSVRLVTYRVVRPILLMFDFTPDGVKGRTKLAAVTLTDFKLDAVR
jgi:hypothetical protein